MINRIIKRFVLRHLNVVVSSRQYGARFRIPIYRNIHSVRETEANILPSLRMILGEKAGIFVDVGANTGQTLLKLKSLRPDVAYVGVEPNPECASYLRSLIELNRFANCDIICSALSAESGFRQLFMRLGTHQISSIAPESRSAEVYNQSQVVAVATGDQLLEFLRGSQKVAAIKIDVEGAENEVLRGFAQLLASDRPTVLFEALPLDSEFEFWNLDEAAIADRRRRAAEIAGVFHQLDYAIYQILGDGSLRAAPDFPAVASHGFDEIDFLASATPIGGF